MALRERLPGNCAGFFFALEGVQTPKHALLTSAIISGKKRSILVSLSHPHPHLLCWHGDGCLCLLMRVLLGEAALAPRCRLDRFVFITSQRWAISTHAESEPLSGVLLWRFLQFKHVIWAVGFIGDDCGVKHVHVAHLRCSHRINDSSSRVSVEHIGAFAFIRIRVLAHTWTWSSSPSLCGWVKVEDIHLQIKPLLLVCWARASQHKLWRRLKCWLGLLIHRVMAIWTVYLFIADDDSGSSGSVTWDRVQPAVRDTRLLSCRWWNSEWKHSAPATLIFFFFFTLLGVISCSHSSSSDGHSSWRPRKTTSRERTGIKLSGRTRSQINNKPKHSCLLSLVTMAAGCLASHAVVWVIYCFQGSDCLCLCYYALRSETGAGPIKRPQHFEQESEWWWQSVAVRGHSSRRSRRRKHRGPDCHTGHGETGHRCACTRRDLQSFSQVEAICLRSGLLAAVKTRW